MSISNAFHISAQGQPVVESPPPTRVGSQERRLRILLTENNAVNQKVASRFLK